MTIISVIVFVLFVAAASLNTMRQDKEIARLQKGARAFRESLGALNIRVAALEERITAMEADATDAEEARLKALEEERRFTEGVQSILGYDHGRRAK